MPKIQQIARNLLLGFWAVLMTALTYVLGAPALKTLRRRLGRGIYWSAGTLIAVGMFVSQATLLAIAFYSLVVLIGVFEEFEEMGLTFRVSAFFSLLINALLSAGGFALWVSRTGPKWSQVILADIDGWIKPLAEINPHLQINTNDLLLQLPSITLISWIIAIYLGVLLESRPNGPAAVVKDTSARPSLRPQLSALKLPDACVWILIASLLGTFGDFQANGIETLAINVLNVSIVLFFFQGIAVVSQFFETVRLSFFWQTVLMFLIVIQLFLFVSVLGLADFWLDFRLRMQKRAAQLNRET